LPEVLAALSQRPLIALDTALTNPAWSVFETTSLGGVIMLEIQFSHCYNSDGTWRSICPECYRTVAESREEADLRQAEWTHVCLSLNGRLVRID
jgi:hypothetical protein